MGEVQPGLASLRLPRQIADGMIPLKARGSRNEAVLETDLETDQALSVKDPASSAMDDTSIPASAE